ELHRPLGHRLLEELEALLDGVALVAVHQLGRRPELLRSLGRHVNALSVPGQSTISIPIERAVPAMVAIAASSEPAVMSGIFSRAMSSSCFRFTWPTFSLPGLCEPEPFFFSVWSPAAFFSSTAAGG